MAVKRTPLTQEQFDRLNVVGGWTINEIPREHWDKIPGLQRLQDTFAIMGSGCVSPGTLNGINAIAGLDVLVHEPRPMALEPPGNAYHYVVQKTSDTRAPYILYGPFKSETIVEHWFDAPQLDRYWSQGDGPIEPDYNAGLGRLEK